MVEIQKLDNCYFALCGKLNYLAFKSVQSGVNQFLASFAINTYMPVKGNAFVSVTR